MFIAVAQSPYMVPASTEEFLDIQATINMIRTYNEMQCTDKHSRHSSIIWTVWLNGWVVAYELSGCWIESHCSLLVLRCGVCFEQGVPWHSGIYRVWIHSETHNWSDKNIQINALYREVITTQVKQLANFAKWGSICLKAKWSGVRVLLQSLNLQIWCLLWAKSSLPSRHL